MQVASSSVRGFEVRKCKMFLVVSDADDLESRRVFVERSEGKMSLCILEGKGKSDERERASSAAPGGVSV